MFTDIFSLFNYTQFDEIFSAYFADVSAVFAVSVWILLDRFGWTSFIQKKTLYRVFDSQKSIAIVKAPLHKVVELEFRENR